MLFNSVSYVLFLAGVTAVFWLIGPRWRIWLLLAASVVFYGLWRPEFLLLIAFSAAVDFYLALKIGAEPRPLRRRLWVVCSVSVNLLMLGYFKYAYFYVGNLEAFQLLLARRDRAALKARHRSATSGRRVVRWR